MKRAAVDDVFQPAGSIVEDALTSHATTIPPYPALPNPVHLARAANRLRQKLRPDDPTDLNFTIQDESIISLMISCRPMYRLELDATLCSLHPRCQSIWPTLNAGTWTPPFM